MFRGMISRDRGGGARRAVIPSWICSAVRDADSGERVALARDVEHLASVWDNDRGMPRTPDGTASGRQQGMVVGETAVAMKQNDKIGLTCCDKSGGLVRRGRQVKCAAGGGGDGDCIGEDCIVYL